MQPNIIFYFSDQQRWDTLTPALMPNVTLLGEQGTRFTDSYTCQPVCGPARACLQTGRYATQCGCFWNGIPLQEGETLLADCLNKGGYDTAYVGKWHLASDRLPGIGYHCEKTAVPSEKRGGYRYWRAADVLEFTSHGYDGYVFDETGKRIDFSGYRADCINDFALEYLDNRPKDKPFFLFVSQLEPHHQNDHGHFEGPRETVEDYRTAPIPADLRFLRGDYEAEYPDYLAAIHRLDDNVGKLVEKLKEQGIYDNTVIIYTSDHGCHFRTRNLEYKRSCHDASIHTPLVIGGGAARRACTEERLVSLIDLPPTILDLAGLPVPESYMGNALLCAEPKERDCVFLQISESQVGRAIRTKKYKYSVRACASGEVCHAASVYYEDYLYDLTKDPIEQYNLVADENYAAVRARLKTMLLREMKNAGEPVPVIRPAKTVRKK